MLTKSLESKSATVNQELSLLTISDVMVNGRIAIPKGSKLVGHVDGGLLIEPEWLRAAAIEHEAAHVFLVPGNTLPTTSRSMSTPMF